MDVVLNGPTTHRKAVSVLNQSVRRVVMGGLVRHPICASAMMGGQVRRALNPYALQYVLLLALARVLINVPAALAIKAQHARYLHARLDVSMVLVHPRSDATAFQAGMALTVTKPILVPVAPTVSLVSLVIAFALRATRAFSAHRKQSLSITTIHMWCRCSLTSIQLM